ncbi:hypothetical protein PG994_012491 [Apiospora phragmitis]|uniref:Uncharacterized protein n=1 Tax=Apiospora phragmitis TaxID=2905665 RepID=A0ABR1TVS7_9PEZI
MNKILIAALLLAANVGALAVPVAEGKNEAVVQDGNPPAQLDESNLANDIPIQVVQDDSAIDEQGNAPGVAKWGQGGGHGGAYGGHGGHGGGAGGYGGHGAGGYGGHGGGGYGGHGGGAGSYGGGGYGHGGGKGVGAGCCHH